MQTTFNPYVNFKNNTRQAMEFYQSIFGGKLTFNTFKEFHASESPEEDDLIMHALLETEFGMTLMAADTPSRMEYRPGTNFSLMLGGDNAAELTAYFEKLSSGGMIVMPLAKAIWGDTFGMCADKFGVSWMVNITG